jgi:hypothetical protein
MSPYRAQAAPAPRLPTTLRARARARAPAAAEGRACEQVRAVKAALQAAALPEVAAYPPPPVPFRSPCSLPRSTPSSLLLSLPMSLLYTPLTPQHPLRSRSRPSTPSRAARPPPARPLPRARPPHARAERGRGAAGRRRSALLRARRRQGARPSLGHGAARGLGSHGIVLLRDVVRSLFAGCGPWLRRGRAAAERGSHARARDARGRGRRRGPLARLPGLGRPGAHPPAPRLRTASLYAGLVRCPLSRPLSAPPPPSSADGRARARHCRFATRLRRRASCGCAPWPPPSPGAPPPRAHDHVRPPAPTPRGREFEQRPVTVLGACL